MLVAGLAAGPCTTYLMACPLIGQLKFCNECPFLNLHLLFVSPPPPQFHFPVCFIFLFSRYAILWHGAADRRQQRRLQERPSSHPLTFAHIYLVNFVAFMTFYAKMLDTVDHIFQNL